MPVSSDQTGMAEEATNRDVLRRSKRLPATRSRFVAKEEEIRFEHIRSTDVMFVDIRDVPEGAKICTIDVGAAIGVPGQIHARVDVERELIYGLTVQNYRAFRRRMFWRYHFASIKKAIRFLIAALRINMSLEGRCGNQHALQT